MSVQSYKSIDAAKLSVSSPYKSENSNYLSDVFMDGSSLVIQTPEVNVSENNVTFKMINKGQFLTLLEDIEEKIVNEIYMNSEKFFKGKKFSEKRIRESLKKTYTVDNSGQVLMQTKLGKGMKIYDFFKEEVNVDNMTFPCEGKCIIKVNPITFDKKDIILDYSITHIKLSLNKKKPEECILSDSEEETQEEVPEPLQLQEEVPEPLEEFLETETKDFDDAEFFD